MSVFFGLCQVWQLKTGLVMRSLKKAWSSPNFVFTQSMSRSWAVLHAASLTASGRTWARIAPSALLRLLVASAGCHRVASGVLVNSQPGQAVDGFEILDSAGILRGCCDGPDEHVLWP
jgi:hypothetical protein